MVEIVECLALYRKRKPIFISILPCQTKEVSKAALERLLEAEVKLDEAALKYLKQLKKSVMLLI